MPIHGEITGDYTKSAVSRTIREGFKKVSEDDPPVTTYPRIYKEKTLQNMTKPCFFIWVMDVLIEKQMRNNYNLGYQMNIRYHPQEELESSYSECMQVGIQLAEYLSMVYMPITVDGVETNRLVKGTQMSYNITDNVLNFFVTYNIRAYIPQEEIEKMKQLIINFIEQQL